MMFVVWEESFKKKYMQQQNQNVKKKSFIENFIRNVKIYPLKRKKNNYIIWVLDFLFENNKK